MSNAFTTAVIMDVLICTFIDGAGGTKGAKVKLKNHLRRAKKTNKKQEVINAIKEILDLETNDSEVFAKIAVTKITNNDHMAECYMDIFQLWESLISKDRVKLSEWNKPWIVNASYAEKFKGGKRFIYTGLGNQLRAATAIAKFEGEQNLSGVLISESKVLEILKRNAAVEKGETLESNPPLCHFANPVESMDGMKTRLGFFNSPTWAIEQFWNYLTPREKKLLDEMVRTRESEQKGFEPHNDELMDLIHSKVQWQSDAHKIKCQNNVAEAYYNPSRDMIAMPMDTQFSSELEFYSCWVHELSHSTDKFLNRTQNYEKLGQRKSYALEEVCAETVAFLAVKRLKNDAESLGIVDEKTAQLFDECFKNSEAYTQAWGNRIKEAFTEILDSKYRNHIFARLIKDVFTCHLSVSTGTVAGKEITR